MLSLKCRFDCFNGHNNITSREGNKLFVAFPAGDVDNRSGAQSHRESQSVFKVRLRPPMDQTVQLAYSVDEACDSQG